LANSSVFQLATKVQFWHELANQKPLLVGMVDRRNSKPYKFPSIGSLAMIKNSIAKLMLGRQSVRRKVCQIIAKTFRLFPYDIRIGYGAIDRPHYGYCVLHAAKLAKSLGHKKVSVIEFGVAGGNGLINLEMHAREVENLLDIDIQIFGFDTGKGLPCPKDYRDLPYYWKPGYFAMDVEKLRKKLTRSELIIGDIAETLPSFLNRHNPAPIGAVFMDLDFYSSTKHALNLFDLARSRILPRVFVYFDDIIGNSTVLYNEYTGVLRAINEFNSSHGEQKICKATHLATVPYPETWGHQIYIYHDFMAADYCKFVSEDEAQLPLNA
jgi:hypothetical protein